MAVFVGISALAFPASSQVLPPPPKSPTIDANGVDVQSAQLQYSQKLMSIGPEGMGGLDYTITFSGEAWRHSFSNVLVNESGDFVPTTEDITIANSSESFTWGAPDQGNGSSSGGFDYLRKDGTYAPFDHYVAGETDPVTMITTLWHFADYIAFPNGVTWTFHYRDDYTGGQQSTRLQSVTTNTGYQMKFYYQTDTITTPASRVFWYSILKVVAINNAVEYCDPDADSCSVSSSWPQVQYTFPSGYNFAVSDPVGNTTSFASAFPNFKVKTADSSTDNIQYTLSLISGDPCVPGSGPNLKITNATINGRSTNYTYSHTPTTETVVSAASLSHTYTYASAVNAGVNISLCRSGVRTMTDPLGRQTTFNFDGYIRMTDATQPEGNSTHLVIDGVTPPAIDNRGNVTQRTANPKSGSGSPTLSESYTFPTCTSSNQKICNQPETYTDPRGHMTTFTYDTSHGGVLTETDPTDSNGIQPVKRYTYAQRYAWIKNASGSYVQAPTPIWLRTGERTCAQTATIGSACAGGSSDEIITSYDYGPNSGPNNLLVRGKVVTAGGVSLRTCYGYDQYGNKISETQPRAGLASCP